MDASTRNDQGLLSVAVYLFDSTRERRFRQQWRDTFGEATFSWADLVARTGPFMHLRGREPDMDQRIRTRLLRGWPHGTLGHGAVDTTKQLCGGISYVLEAGDDGQDQLEHLLSSVSKSPELQELYQWSGHSTVPKTPCAPFHAPDMLAWEMGKWCVESIFDKKRPMRLSLVHLLKDRVDDHFS